MTTSWRPLRNGGSSGSGGKLITRSAVVTDSGRSRVHSAHARVTAGACSRSHSSMPPTTSTIGNSWNSSAVTTPRLPPPPRSAQNSSTVLFGVGAQQVAISGDHLDRRHVVGGQAEGAGVPGQAATEGVAGHGHVRGAAVHRSESVRGGSVHDVSPQGAAEAAGDSTVGVDADPRHLGELHDHDVGKRLGAERAGVVTGALRGDPQSGGRRRTDHGHDLVGVTREGDRCRSLVDGEVPGQSSRVVARVAGQVYAAGAQAAESRGAIAGAGVERCLEGHPNSFCSRPVPCLDAVGVATAHSKHDQHPDGWCGCSPENATQGGSKEARTAVDVHRAPSRMPARRWWRLPGRR